jgi:hypothetical protein
MSAAKVSESKEMRVRIKKKRENNGVLSQEFVELKVVDRVSY